MMLSIYTCIYIVCVNAWLATLNSYSLYDEFSTVSPIVICECRSGIGQYRPLNIGKFQYRCITYHYIKAWFILAILSAIFLLLPNVIEWMTCKMRELFLSEKRLHTFVCKFTHLHPLETPNRRQKCVCEPCRLKKWSQVIGLNVNYNTWPQWT